MAQWGLIEDWADYYAGRRARPPSTPLAPGTERVAWEQAAATMKVDKDRAARFAAYCREYGVAEVTR